MGNYNIKVNIEIEESKDSIINQPSKSDGGCFKITISEADAVNIDKCEKALLETSYKAIREGISAHLEEVSKKNDKKNKRRGFDN
jgi:hypothetical protein